MGEDVGHKRILFEGIANFRDIGGLPIGDGYTRYGVFYRSTHWAYATDSDFLKLKDLHVTSVLDLRHRSETEKMPDRIPDGMSYRAISLLGPLDPGDLHVNGHVRDTKTLFRMYRQILEEAGAAIVSVLEYLAFSPSPVVFHCAAGKDRTGLVAMFLHSVVGVDRRDIVAEYETSHTYIHGFTDDISGSHYQNMDTLLRFLDEKYDGPVGYLRQMGVPEEVFAALVEKQ